MIRGVGRICWSARPTPLTVPPVPTAATKASNRSPASAWRISRAVDSAWARGFSGLSNCEGMNAPGVAAASSRAFSRAPSIWRSGSVRTSSAP
jgi:hypothetical protein